MERLESLHDMKYIISTFEGVQTKCRACGTRFPVSAKALNEKTGLSCPHCRSSFKIKLIEDAILPVWVAGGLEFGYIEITKIPELPEQRRKRFTTELGLDKEGAQKVTAEKSLSDFFEDCVEISQDTPPTRIASLITDELKRELKHRDMPIDSVSSDSFTDVVERLQNDEITEKQFVDVMRTALDDGKRMENIAESIETDVFNETEIEEVCKNVIDEHPSVVEDYLSGKEEAVNRLIGEVIQKTDGAVGGEEARNNLIRLIQSRTD